MTMDETLYGYDYLHRATPQRMVRPTTLGELQEALREIHEHNAKGVTQRHATVRVSYNSLDAQALNENTVIDLRPTVDANGHEVAVLRDYARIEPVQPDGTVWVGAFVSFRELLKAIVAQGWMTCSMPTGPDITVGGSLAAGGISRFSHVWGLEHEQALAIDVLTPDGTVHQNVARTAPLFRAVVTGHGWGGVILRVRLQLRRVCDARQSLRAETAVTRYERRDGQTPNAYFLQLLGELYRAGNAARDAREQLGQHAFVKRLEGHYDAQSMVGFFVGRHQPTVHYQSKFIPANEQRTTTELPIYQGMTAARRFGEWALSLPAMHSLAEWFYFRSLRERVYVNDYDPFVFFMEGNVELRRRFNGGAGAVLKALGAEARDQQSAASRLTRARRARVAGYDLPGTMYALQQSHLFETADAAAEFLAWAWSARSIAWWDKPTLFDLLYLPGSNDAPYLAATGNAGGFLVTFAWQELLSQSNGMFEEMRMAQLMVNAAERLGGKVSLLKNVYGARGQAGRMLGANAIAAFVAERAVIDPHRVLHNEFAAEHLGI